MDYNKIVEEAKSKALTNFSEDGWKTSNKSCNEFTLDLKPSKDNNGSMLRIQLTLDAPLDLCKNTITLMPGSRRPEWDQDVREIKLIKDIDDKTVLFYVHTNPVAKGVISAREFVDVGRTEVTENQVSVFGCTVDHPQIQTDDKYVRGCNAFWMHRFTKDPSNEGRTKIESVLDSDMKGWLPASLINSTLPVVFSQALNTWLEFVKKEQSS